MDALHCKSFVNDPQIGVRKIYDVKRQLICILVISTIAISGCSIDRKNADLFQSRLVCDDSLQNVEQIADELEMQFFRPDNGTDSFAQVDGGNHDFMLSFNEEGRLIHAQRMIVGKEFFSWADLQGFDEVLCCPKSPNCIGDSS